MASACANLEWLGATVTFVPLVTMVLVPQAVKPASVALREHSVACVKGLLGSVLAELVPLGFTVTAANMASGDSLIAGHVSAMGMQMNVTPTQALA